MLDALGERLDVAVHHRRGRRHPQAMRVPHHAEPVRGLRLLRRDDVADTVDEDLGASARNRVEARVAQARQRGRDGQLRAPRDVLDLRRRQRVQVDRVALLERAKEILVVVDPEIRVMPALHEHAGAADRKRLLDLLVDDGLREQVPLGAVARPAVERAEVAVGDADVRVVDVAVDDERDPPRVGAARTELVRGLADRDEVLRLEERERFFVGDALAVEGLLEDRRGHARQSLTLFISSADTSGPMLELFRCPKMITLPFVASLPLGALSCFA